MYFIEKEEDLIGKEIVFTHLAQFAEAMTIVTKDKGIIVFQQDEEEIFIYRKHTARSYIFHNEWIRKQLNKLEIITSAEVEEYENELRRQAQEAERKRQEAVEKTEYEIYLKLKEKYEG